MKGQFGRPERGAGSRPPWLSRSDCHGHRDFENRTHADHRGTTARAQNRRASPSADPPTRDMVRESLFNIVRELVVDRLVIDLFAGTGALGLEALSRGPSGRSSSRETEKTSA